MDSLTSRPSHGDTSPRKVKKNKRKSAYNVPHCDLLGGNISVDNELHHLAEEKVKRKLKKKKHKNKDNCEEADVIDLTDVGYTDKKKRKLVIDESASGESGTLGPNLIESRPKKKKKSMDETKSLLKVGEESTINVFRDGKQKLLNINLATSIDSILSLHPHKMVPVFEKYKVGEESQVKNSTIQLCEAAGKKKKKKEANLSTQIDGFSGKQCVEDTKKAEEESSFMETGCSSLKAEEESIEEVFPTQKKKRKHKRSSVNEEEVDKRLNIEKEKPSQGNMSLESSSAEGNDTDKILLDGCSKKQKRKDKMVREKVSGSRICGVSHDDDSLNQENIVENLWNKIRSKIELKIQESKKDQNEETSSQQPEQVLAGNDSDEVEDSCYSMAFKFDNNPNFKNYVPYNLMVLNGLNPDINEITEIDLKIPRTNFKGSSLDKIPGYGYNN